MGCGEVSFKWTVYLNALMIIKMVFENVQIFLIKRRTSIGCIDETIHGFSIDIKFLSHRILISLTGILL